MDCLATIFCRFFPEISTKSLFEKLSHICPWITWYIRAGHGILCLGSLKLILSIFKRIAIQVLYKHFRGDGGSEAMLILLIYGGGGIEFGKTCLYNANSLPISHVSINNNTNKNFNNKNNKNNKKQQQQQKQQKQKL